MPTLPGPDVDGRTDRAHDHMGRVFALLAATQVALIMAIGLPTLGLPAIQTELALSTGQLALFNAAYGLSFAGLLLLGGRVADMVGRRRVFTLGVAMFALATGVVAVSPSAAVLLAARFTQGIGAAFAAPAALALVHGLYPEAGRRSRALAMWGGLSSAGAIGGVVLGGLVTAATSWRWGLVIPAVLAVAALAARRWLPKDGPVAPARLDVPGAVLVTTGLTGLSYALVSTLDQSWPSPTVLVSLLGGLALLGGFVAVERRSAAPLLPLGFLASSRRATALLTIMLASAGIATTGMLLSLYFQQVRGFSPLATATLFLPYFAILGTSIVAGRVMSRTGSRTVTVTGLVTGGVGLLMLSQLGPATSYVVGMLPGLVLFTIGVGLSFAGATVAVFADVPDHQAGLAGGVLNTAMEMGPTIGLAVLVSLAGMHTAALTVAGAAEPAATSGGYGFAFGAAGVAYVVVAVIAARTLRPRRTPHLPGVRPGSVETPEARSAS